MVRDLWRHIRSSLSMRELISFFKASSLTELPPWSTLFSTCVSSFLFFLQLSLMLPKQSWLHLVSAFPQFSTFQITLELPSFSYLACQTPSTVSPQPLSPSHISSNLNIFFFCKQSNFECSIHKNL